MLSSARLYWLDTLATPNVIAVDASEHRASLATRANVLSEALDAQLTTRASNSVEKMLCHQMAVCHTAAMETFIRLRQAPVAPPPVETARLQNSAVRLLEAFQGAALALLKLQQGGTQRVEVRYQQVNVNDGGQAVVTETVSRRRRGSRKTGRGGKHGR